MDVPLPTRLFPRPLGRIAGDYAERMEWHYEATPLLLPPPPPPPEPVEPSLPRRSLAQPLALACLALFVVYAFVTS